MQDYFKKKAQKWDKGNVRVNGAKIIAENIQKRLQLTPQMEILDFGVGTGLLGFEIAKQVKHVVGVDTSASMLEKLKEKNTPELFIEPLEQDIIAKPLDEKFDGIISSMTLHHVENLEAFFSTIKNNLKPGGFIAIADLEKEDGTFHSDNTGVYHFGFDKEKLINIVQQAGFNDIFFKTINTIEKPHRDFKVFLLSAKMQQITI